MVMAYSSKNKTAAPRDLVDQTLGRARWAFFAVGGFSLAINLLILTVPLYMLQVFDRVLTSRSADTLLMLTLLALFLLAAFGILDALRQRVLIREAAKFEQTINDGVFPELLRRRLRGLGGAENQAFSFVQAIRGFMSSPGFLAFFDAPWSPIFIGLIFLFHPLPGVISLFGALILIGLAIGGEAATRRAYMRSATELRSSARFAEATLRNAEAVHAMGMGSAVQGRWQTRHDAGLVEQVGAQEIGGMTGASAKAVRLMIQVLVLGSGAYLAINDVITPGVMFAAAVIMGRALAPIELAIAGWRSFVSARDAYGRLNELLQQADEDREDHMPLPEPNGHLQVNTLTAGAPGSGQAFLRGISFELQPGELIGIIGPSAAGKSMLARLLVGVWAPMSGVVRLDGADVAAWHREDVGPHIGYLPQDVELLSGTVQDNIARFGTVDPDKVVEAARNAGVHEMILALPDGYETVIGQEGGILSAGQRQRVALARALYGNPVLIVLDEPNSNLDGEGEAALQRALQLMKDSGSTIAIVSHRAAALAPADKLLMLRNGRMEAFGPRDEVLAKVTRTIKSDTAQQSQIGHDADHKVGADTEAPAQ